MCLLIQHAAVECLRRIVTTMACAESCHIDRVLLHIRKCGSDVYLRARSCGTGMSSAYPSVYDLVLT